MQSPEGQALLRWADQPQHEFNTIVLIADHQLYIRSEAMFSIFARISAPWRWLRVARIIPAPFRDWMYDKLPSTVIGYLANMIPAIAFA